MSNQNTFIEFKLICKSVSARFGQTYRSNGWIKMQVLIQ